MSLKSVPNMGPVSIKALEAAGISNTFQLLGQFLCYKKRGLNTQAHCDAFYEFLEEAGARHAPAHAAQRNCNASNPNPPLPSVAGTSASHRSSVVLCIAKKANFLLPGIFDEAECKLKTDDA
jgi:hypothetical protein